LIRKETTNILKITKVSTLIVNANIRNWLFVKVETDQPGLYGWGIGSFYQEAR